MKFSLKSTNNKNRSQLNMKQLNSARYSNQEKILSSKTNISENLKSLVNSNSNLDIKSNVNKRKKLAAIKSGLNLDNIDESNYKQDLYIIPQKNTARKLYTSNIEKAIETYNGIKQEINKKLNNKKNFTTNKSIQMHNFSLVNLLEKLNKILDIIVQRSRVTSNKNRSVTMSESQVMKRNKEIKSVKNISKKLSEKVINNRLLNSYKQQYNLLTSKFDSLTKGDYAISLKENITKQSKEISTLEKENKEFHREQSRNALILKNLKTSKNEDNYKKKLDEYDKLFLEYEILNKHIKLKEGEIQANEKRISKLEENKINLIKKAKEEYKIQNPEEVINEKKNEKEEEKIRLYIKRKEIENKTLIINNTIKRLVIMEKDNKKFIRELEEKVADHNYYLKKKKEEIVKLNEILDKMDIENNNLDYEQNDTKNINNNLDNQNMEQLNNKEELNKNLKQKNINLSNPDISIEEMNNRYSLKKEKNQNNLQVAKTYNKKMILQQLDDQKKREQDGLNRIKLNKKNLKPNFSFSLNNSSKKEPNEKNVNLSAAILSKKNEIEGEIKEDIKIIPYDDNNKIKLEDNEQRIITNMSQNMLSLEKKEENIIEDTNVIDENKVNEDDISDEKNRQKVLNTLPFYDLEESEKNLKMEEHNNSEENNGEKKKDNEENKEEKKLNEKDNENGGENNENQDEVI